MLFNSYEFILIFLPLTALGYWTFGHFQRFRWAMYWLALASLCFYGWWNPKYVPLILGSTVFNYFWARGLLRQPSPWKLGLGVAANLGLLGYFKYANFFVENANLILGSQYRLDEIILPLAISFFTFQQIAYLVDVYRNKKGELDFLKYLTFVSFFPQLIAGPIVHHKEVLPQFQNNKVFTPQFQNIAFGICLFTLGLFKKVIFADNIARFSSPIFSAAEMGTTLSFFEAWGGALAYTLQIYFDFSGYSDMAMGLGRLFGIRIPLNFNSPYKALDISDFWRRWHITLSKFLRDYLYIALGGNRKGSARRYSNLMITMLLGGLWHGASWTFVFWGGLHGMYLILCHFWKHLQKQSHWTWTNSLPWRITAQAITFVAVVFAWVFFRGESFAASMSLVKSMLGMHGLVFPQYTAALGLQNLGFAVAPIQLSFQQVLWTTALLCVVFFLPNVQQWVFHRFEQGFALPKARRFEAFLAWQPHRVWAVVLAIMGLMTLFQLSAVSEFIYYQF